MGKTYAIGADIGGSHITCAVVDLKSQKPLKETQKRQMLSHNDTAENIFIAWAKAIDACIASVDVEQVAGIGFAIPGPFKYKEGFSLMEHKYPALYKLHIPTELKKHLKSADKNLPMHFNNDASSFAIGESWLGKGRGFKRVIVLTLGTGFGSAYIENELPVVDGDNIAPEGCFWHLPFKEGIADDYFSTGWFVKRYKELTNNDIEGVKEIIDSDLDTANKLFKEFAQNLSLFMTPWLKKFSADVLVLGGNISLAYDYFKEALLKEFKENEINVKVEVSSLMEDAAIVGAARLVEDDFWNRISNNLPNI